MIKHKSYLKLSINKNRINSIKPIYYYPTEMENNRSKIINEFNIKNGQQIWDYEYPEQKYTRTNTGSI